MTACRTQPTGIPGHCAERPWGSPYTDDCDGAQLDGACGQRSLRHECAPGPEGEGWHLEEFGESPWELVCLGTLVECLAKAERRVAP